MRVGGRKGARLACHQWKVSSRGGPGGQLGRTVDRETRRRVDRRQSLLNPTEKVQLGGTAAAAPTRITMD